MDAIIPLILIVALVWFWIDSMKAREIALSHCVRRCNEIGVQFLDQTVRLARLRLGRGRDGRLHIRRVYAYEYSTGGDDRWNGTAQLLGQRLEYLRMEHPDGPIIVDFSGKEF